MRMARPNARSVASRSGISSWTPAGWSAARSVMGSQVSTMCASRSRSATIASATVLVVYTFAERVTSWFAVLTHPSSSFRCSSLNADMGKPPQGRVYLKGTRHENNSQDPLPHRPASAVRVHPELRASDVEPAAHVETGPRHVGGRVGRQIDDGARHISGRSEPPEDDLAYERLPPVLAQRIRHGRLDIARRDGIHGDSPRADLAGEGLREPDDAGLGRGIVRLARVTHEPHDGRDVHDAPRDPFLQHDLRGLLGAEEDPREVGREDLVPGLLRHPEDE